MAWNASGQLKNKLEKIYETLTTKTTSPVIALGGVHTTVMLSLSTEELWVIALAVPCQIDFIDHPLDSLLHCNGKVKKCNIVSFLSEKQLSSFGLFWAFQNPIGHPNLQCIVLNSLERLTNLTSSRVRTCNRESLTIQTTSDVVRLGSRHKVAVAAVSVHLDNVTLCRTHILVIIT